LDSICDAPTRRRLENLGRLVISEDRAMPDEMVDQHLPETVLLFGQTAMPRERIERAGRLKAIFNVETNFLPNIDCAACRDRGVWVLAPTAAFAEAVAESALGMAIDLARGITVADRAFRARTEKFGLDGNEKSFMFTRAPVSIIGFGDLGRKLRALIAPFRNPVSVYDPWLPDDLIRSHDCTPVGLDDLLRTSRVVFMFASVTTETRAS
jgi:phosphoglycerate dehydrogenase-like enzyme